MMSPAQQQLGQPQQRFAPQTSLETETQADVAAVLAALQNGQQIGQLPRDSNIGGGGNFPPHPSNNNVDNTRQMNQHPAKSQRRSSVRPNPPAEPDHNFGDMMFGDSSISGPAIGGPLTQRTNQPPDLQWGSDPSFAKSQAFVPNSREDTHEALERKRVDLLQIFELNKSAATTRASSPVRNGENNMTDLRGAKPARNIKEEHAPLASPIKRRKSKPKEEDDEADDSLSPIPPKPAAKKRKSKADTNGPTETSTAPKEMPGKRRRSAAGGAKAPRENLTEAQKRENHIKSEQKRRGAIKEGYQELSQIVPNLGSSGYSKSMMLTMAADWLEDLIRGNEELSKR